MKPIKNTIFLIEWLTGEGKTFFSAFLACFYSRVFSNFDIFIWKNKHNISIQRFIDLEKIKFSDTKWLLIIDEWWSNLSGRRSMSKANMEISKLWMISRKKNIDVCIIWQDVDWIDVNFRQRLSKYFFRMESFFRSWELEFEVEISRNYKWKSIILWYKKIDLILFSEITWLKYDTLEESQFF